MNLKIYKLLYRMKIIQKTFKLKIKFIANINILKK